MNLGALGVGVRVHKGKSSRVWLLSIFLYLGQGMSCVF